MEDAGKAEDFKAMEAASRAATDSSPLTPRRRKNTSIQLCSSHLTQMAKKLLDFSQDDP